jgi:hypothetical protein
MTTGALLSFSTFTLLLTVYPTGTVPKSTVLGVIPRTLDDVTFTPDPQPDVANIRPQATEKAKAVNQLSHQQGGVPDQSWNLLSFREVAGEVKIAYLRDTNITS